MTCTRCATTWRRLPTKNQDTDFTWAEFIRRNNDELVATWGNLVNRRRPFAARNIGSIPEPGHLTEWDRDVLTGPAGVRPGRRRAVPIPVQGRG